MCNICESGKWIEAATFQYLLFKFHLQSRIPWQGYRSNCKKKKGRGTVPLDSPYSIGAAAFLSALSIELHVQLHLNKSILLLKNG